MGTRCSSELRRGQINITMKLLLLTAFAAVTLATDEEAAKPVAILPASVFGHQLLWPGHCGAGYSSQCWGCFGRKRRSAEAAPEADPQFGFLPYAFGLPYAYAVPAVTLPAFSSELPDKMTVLLHILEMPLLGHKELHRELLEDASVKQKLKQRLILDFCTTLMPSLTLTPH